MDYAELFNRKLNDFLEDLEAIGIRSVADYPLLKASCQLLASVDKARPADMFLRYVVGPYEDQIVRRNEDFFLKETYKSVSADMAIVNAIKQIWSTLDLHNKDAIWQHMLVLMVLSKKCVEGDAPRADSPDSIDK